MPYFKMVRTDRVTKVYDMVVYAETEQIARIRAGVGDIGRVANKEAIVACKPRPSIAETDTICTDCRDKDIWSGDLTGQQHKS